MTYRYNLFQGYNNQALEDGKYEYHRQEPTHFHAQTLIHQSSPRVV